MKIAIIGSHSVGKTTLVNELSKHIDLPIISEVARAFPRDPTKSPEWEIYRGFQIFTKQMVEEIKAVKDNGGFISDRSTVDNAAYMTLSLHSRAPHLSFEVYTEALNNIHRAITWAEDYNYLFYIPIEFPVVDDGFRDIDEDTRKYIDECILKYTILNSLDVIVITGSVEERIQQVLYEIRL